MPGGLIHFGLRGGGGGGDGGRSVEVGAGPGWETGAGAGGAGRDPGPMEGTPVIPGREPDGAGREPTGTAAPIGDATTALGNGA